MRFWVLVLVAALLMLGVTVAQAETNQTDSLVDIIWLGYIRDDGNEGEVTYSLFRMRDEEWGNTCYLVVDEFNGIGGMGIDYADNSSPTIWCD